MADKKTKTIRYSEPADYFPKELMNKFNKNETKTTKKTVKGSKKKIKK